MHVLTIMIYRFKHSFKWGSSILCCFFTSVLSKHALEYLYRDHCQNVHYTNMSGLGVLLIITKPVFTAVYVWPWVCSEKDIFLMLKNIVKTHLYSAIYSYIYVCIPFQACQCNCVHLISMEVMALGFSYMGHGYEKVQDIWHAKGVCCNTPLSFSLFLHLWCGSRSS